MPNDNLEMAAELVQRLKEPIQMEETTKEPIYRGNEREQGFMEWGLTGERTMKALVSVNLELQEIKFSHCRNTQVLRQEPVGGFKRCTQAELPKVGNKKSRKKYYESQKKKAKTHGGGVMDEKEIAAMEHLRTSKWGQKDWMKQKVGGETQGDIYNQVLQGRYENFEKLDVTLRNTLASRYMQEVFTMPVAGQTPGEYVRALKKKAGMQGLMNPLFRLGMSLAMKNGWNGVPKEYFRQMDDKCGTEIMLETLSRRISQADMPQNQAGNFGDAKAKMEKGQKFMATNLFLMHLGNMTKVTSTDGEKSSEPWADDVATAMTHCSRVAVTTPVFRVRQGEQESAAKAEYQEMWKKLRGTSDSGAVGTDFTGENSYGLFRRGASTHSFNPRKLSKPSPFKEKKVVANFFGQEGVNVAIGGLYNGGVGGQTIKQDGSCGHIYSMRQEETKDQCGGFLLGFESDAHKMTNQLGHTHGFGNGEYASSFGSQRVDEIGDKYGGRQVDVSHMSAGAINEHLEALHRYMDHANANNIDTTPVMEKLVGKHMNAQGLSDFMHYLEQHTPQG